MERQDVIACLIMESVMEPVKPKDVQVFDRNGLFYLRFNTILQEFDALNRNRRIYGLAPAMQSLKAPHIVELMEKKSWKGEAGHPMTKETSRILTIDPTLTSHKINSIEFNGNLLYGQIETLDDGAEGTRMTRNILQGMEPAFSLRALASLTKNRDGTSIVRSPFHVVTYDWVILPSHKKAYRDESRPIEKVSKSFTDGAIMTESSITISVMESQIKDFIRMESKNVNLVSSIYEVSLENMQLTPDGNHVILRENGNTFSVKLEDKIKRDTARYMSNLF